MGVYKSAGIYTIETDWSTVYPVFQKKLIRKDKVEKIFGLDKKSPVITSTPKGPNNFPIIAW